GRAFGATLLLLLRPRARRSDELLVSRANLVDRPVHTQLALVDPQGAGAHGFDRFQRVADEEDRTGVLPNLVDTGLALGAKLRIAGSQRLVDHQDVGTG